VLELAEKKSSAWMCTRHLFRHRSSSRS
jgi:hypothetical protein